MHFFFPFFSSLLIYPLYASFLFSFFILLVHKLFLCFPHFSSLVCIYFIFSFVFFNWVFFLSLTSISPLYFLSISSFWFVLFLLYPLVSFLYHLISPCLISSCFISSFVFLLSSLILPRWLSPLFIRGPIPISGKRNWDIDCRINTIIDGVIFYVLATPSLTNTNFRKGTLHF